MQTVTARRRWLVGLSPGLLLMTGVTQAAIHVELEVDASASPPSLTVTSNDARCAGQPLDCIEVAKGSNPNIYFDLDRACRSGGPTYKLKQIRIAAAEKHWPTPGNPLPADVADDFNADRNSGIIDLEAGNNSLSNSRIKMKDKNNVATNMFYEITAAHCTDPSQPDAVLDPQVQNKGK